MELDRLVFSRLLCATIKLVISNQAPSYFVSVRIRKKSVMQFDMQNDCIVNWYRLVNPSLTLRQKCLFNGRALPNSLVCVSVYRHR